MITKALSLPTGEVIGSTHPLMGDGFFFAAGLLRQILVAFIFLAPLKSSTGDMIVVSLGEDIQLAMDQASDFDAVHVEPGSYILAKPLRFAGKKIALRSELGPEVTFLIMGEPTDPLAASVFIFENGETEDSVVDGFTIQGGLGTQVQDPFNPPLQTFAGGGILCLDNSSPLLQNCHFTGNKHGAITCIRSSPEISYCQFLENSSGLICIDFSSPKVRECSFRRNLGTPIGISKKSNPEISRCEIIGNHGNISITMNSSPVIRDSLFQGNFVGPGYTGGSGSPIFINCIIVGNGNRDQNYESQGFGALFRGEPVILINCLIVGNRGPGVRAAHRGSANLIHCTIAANYEAGIAVEKSGSVRLKNCIVWSNRGGAVSVLDDGKIEAEHSILEEAEMFPGEGNVNQDPEFLHLAEVDFERFNAGNADFILDPGDFRLKEGSPAIDMGAELFDIAAFDLDLNPRPCGRGFDIGAYEHCGPFFFQRGDADGNGAIDMSDAVFTLLHLFAGGAGPPCEKAADSNDTGQLDVTDAVYLLLHLFAGGEPPAAPRIACGEDKSQDSLTCLRFDPCEV